MLVLLRKRRSRVAVFPHSADSHTVQSRSVASAVGSFSSFFRMTDCFSQLLLCARSQTFLCARLVARTLFWRTLFLLSFAQPRLSRSEKQCSHYIPLPVPGRFTILTLLGKLDESWVFILPSSNEHFYQYWRKQASSSPPCRLPPRKRSLIPSYLEKKNNHGSEQHPLGVAAGCPSPRCFCLSLFLSTSGWSAFSRSLSSTRRKRLELTITFVFHLQFYTFQIEWLMYDSHAWQFPFRFTLFGMPYSSALARVLIRMR